MKAIPRARRTAGRRLVPVLLALSSCASGPPPTEEFMLRQSPPASASAAAPTLPAIRVKTLVPRGFLDRSQIAWREGDVRSGVYHYRRWSELPADAATRALIETLRARGAFAQVDGSASRPIGPLTLSGELLGLHEESGERGERPRGVAAIELVLEIESGDPGVTSIRRLFASRREVDATDESMEALVRAVGDALQQALAEIVPAIETAAAESAPAR